VAKRELNLGYRSPLVLILLIGALGCAKEGIPPGGPVDEVAPQVVSMFPEPGSTNVDRGQPIVFRFSEPMEHRSTERSLFFTPDIGSTLRVEWKGRELHLIPLLPYRENTTIVVTIGADAADLRRNRLGRSITLAFSTGSALDVSSVGGSVVEDGRFVTGAWVWIYPVGEGPGQEAGADPALLSAPEPSFPLYITQADNTGRFEQTHMSQGIYRVFAFRDADGNRRFDLDNDPLAVPPADIRCGKEDYPSSGMVLNVALRDTTGPIIRSASAPNSDYVHIRFSEPPAAGSIPLIALEPYMAEEGVDSFAGTVRVVRSYLPLNAPTTLAVQVEGLEPGTRYRARLLEVRDALGNPGRHASRPITFSIPAQADTTRPLVTEVTPADSSLSLNRDTRLRLTFSTEIDTSGLQQWVLVGPDTIRLESFWLDPHVVELVPRDDVVPDAFYQLSIEAQSLRSWTGLSGPADDYTPAWRGIRPAGRGTLRFRVDGKPLPGPGRYRVIIEGVGSGTAPRTEIELTDPSELTTPELPVGPYWVWGFADADGDGVLNVGRIRPYMPAEAVGVISDTLYVINTFESVYDIPLILGTIDPDSEGAGDLR